MNAARLIALIAAAFAGALMLSPAPAAAQDAPQDAPWYMPQPWMSPQNTAPKVASRPGQYGHAKHSQVSYGSFSNGCYGACGHRVGTIVTGNNLVLFRPRVVIYDPRAFNMVPRNTILVTQGGFIIRGTPTAQQQKAMAALSKKNPMQPGVIALKGKSTPLMARQNGVRVYTPNPSY